VIRALLAIVFARTLAEGGWSPVAVFALAAASDYVDGPIARRAGGATRYGVLLDSGADVAFVTIASSAGAVLGRLSWFVPVSILASAVPYLVATWRWGRAHEAPARAYSAVGHAAGVSNYVLAGLLAGSTAVPDGPWPVLLGLGSAVVVGLNLTAVAARLASRARARRPSGSTGRGTRSTP